MAANGTMTGIYAAGLSTLEQADLVGREFGDREYVRRALAGETYVSDPVEAESGFRIVTVSTPVYDAGGEDVVATFNAAFHLDQGDVEDLLAATATGQRGVRIRANGSPVYAAGATGADADVVAANSTVEEVGWVVTATERRASFASRVWTVTLTGAVAFLLVLASLAVFGWWLYREYVGNFERLQGGFGSLVAGDYGTTVELSGATEWEALESQFNELSRTLAQRRTEVSVLNRVLRHNLRNAMTVVVGNADRIEARTDDERTATEARRIRQRGESLLELADHARAVESSLDDPTDEAGVQSVADVVEDVVTVLAEEFPSATFEVNRLPEDGRVRGGDLLAVAVDELARNAVVHAECPDPTVTFAATVTDDRVRITVADDGPGMPPVEQRVLTEPFVETATEHGQGLGLWLVTWLVQRVDGEIDVVVDDGTKVMVDVPRATTAERDDEEPETLAPDSTGLADLGLSRTVEDRSAVSDLLPSNDVRDDRSEVSSDDRSEDPGDERSNASSHGVGGEGR